jgi:FkbM family methyltransferase
MNPVIWIKRYLHALVATRSFYWSRILVRHSVYAGHFCSDQGIVRIKQLDLALPQTLTPTLKAFLAELDKAILLHRDVDATYAFAGADIDVTIDGTTFGYLPTSLETVVEIWQKQLYNFQWTADCVVIDIGMNVGYASLFFARMGNVKRVYAFEPFDFSFQRAKSNFAMNPQLEQKIVAHNAAVGEAAGAVEAQFSPEQYVGAHLGSYSDEDCGRFTFTKETVNVLAAADLLRGVIAENPGTAIVAKIDCEGAEYGILKAWDEAGLIREIDAFLIEWHDLGVEPLSQRLGAAGYIVFAAHPHDRSNPMLYAVRRDTACLEADPEHAANTHQRCVTPPA